MDADNYVGPAAGGLWVAVAGGIVVGYFLSQAEAEHAYRAARGELGAPAPAASSPCGDVLLECGPGKQGAPVNGGCWCCRSGCWATEPAYCREPLCHECGNQCLGGGGGGGQAPQQGAPVSPGSSLPSGPAPATSGPSTPTQLPVLDVDSIAGRLGVSRREMYALAGIAAAVLVLR